MIKQKNFRFQVEQEKKLEEVKGYLNKLHGGGLDMYSDTTALMYCIAKAHEMLKKEIEGKEG